MESHNGHPLDRNTTPHYPSKWIEAGFMVRGNLRMALAKAGWKFNEIKYGGRSVFIFDCTDADYDGLVRELSEKGFL